MTRSVPVFFPITVIPLAHRILGGVPITENLPLFTHSMRQQEEYAWMRGD